MAKLHRLAGGGLLLGLLAPAPVAAQLPDVVELTVADVRAGLAARRFTAVELTRAFLDRIERYEGRYNANNTVADDMLP